VPHASPTRQTTPAPSLRLANAALAAIGLLALGAMIGGWATTQPVRSPTDAVTGLAVDPNGNFLYRTFASGRIERLVLGRGVTKEGTTAEWEFFIER
jgi:hypothetical protein